MLIKKVTISRFECAPLNPSRVYRIQGDSGTLTSTKDLKFYLVPAAGVGYSNITVFMAAVAAAAAAAVVASKHSAAQVQV